MPALTFFSTDVAKCNYTFAGEGAQEPHIGSGNYNGMGQFKQKIIW